MPTDPLQSAICDAISEFDHIRPDAQAVERSRSLLGASPSPVLRCGAAILLALAPRDEATFQVLRRAVEQDEDGRVRARAAEALAEVGTDEGLGLLRQLAADQDGRVRASAAAGLGKLLSPTRLLELHEAATDEAERETYRIAIWYSVHGAV